MSMDPLTAVAVDSLEKVLPKLLKQLAEIKKLVAENREPTDELKFLCQEAFALFEMLSNWSKAGVAAVAEIESDAAIEAEIDNELSDDEAMAMLQAMDEAPIEEAPKAKTEPEAASEDMSDEEAMAMLQAMDAPADAPSAESTSGDMSDDEARKLLEAMDSPSPTPQVPVAAAEDEDEAMKMLAAMGGLDDAPAAPAKSAPAATPVPVAAAADAGPEVPEIEEWEKNDFASDPEMMKDFTTNSADLMQALDDTILRLEQNPTDKETIEEIFRAAHTFKGAAGMFGFKAIERLMHRMENIFDNVRKGKLKATSDTIDAIFLAIDLLKKLLQAVLDGKPCGLKTGPTVRILELASEGKKTGASRNSAPAEGAPAAATEQAPPSDGSGHAPAAKKNEQTSTIRVDLERLDALVNLVGELVIDRTRFSSIEEHLRMVKPQPKVVGNMTETVQLFGRHMNDMQEMIMKIRMVPIGNAFNKFPRVVRDLARNLGKQIDLFIEGEETELDKTLVEQIGDPLIHLVRNACDHGAEMPEVRKAAGKKPNSTVTLSARQEGNAIIISISDDGKGMDVERIRAKGIERGLITEDQQLSERDIFNLIFEAGFSTAEVVTNVSGRGVGMDVVRKQISKLKGMIEISSKPGKGSTITIHLPLTLAIVQTLIVGVQEETFAIPLSSVVESIRIKPEDIQKVGDTDVIKLRDYVLPIVYLDEALDLQAKEKKFWYRALEGHNNSRESERKMQRRDKRLYVVVVGTADRRFGIIVDQLLNQQEMVIKPMGPLMKWTPCVSGGAVLGNGDVVLVMDVPQIQEQVKQRSRNPVRA